MSYTVSPADDDDVRKIVGIMFKAYGGKNEYINAVFPRGLTDEGSENTTQRLLFIKSAVKGVIMEKVVSTATGRLIGGAMWGLYEEAKPKKFDLDGPPGTWSTDEEKEYAQALYRTFGDDEDAYLEDKSLPILRLTILAIDPEFQRRGAGAALVESGLALADKVDAPVTLVATPESKGLYEKYGFYTLKERVLHVPEKFAHRPKVRIWSMARDKRASVDAEEHRGP